MWIRHVCGRAFSQVRSLLVYSSFRSPHATQEETEDTFQYAGCTMIAQSR